MTADDVPSLADIAPRLRGCQLRLPPEVARRPFVGRFKPPWTRRLPPPKPWTTDYEPHYIEDLLLAETLKIIRDWIAVQLHNLLMIKQYGPAAKAYMKATGTCVIPQSGFHPLARGVVWDVRNHVPGNRIKPLDVTAPIESDFDLGAWAERFKHWPDQECLGFLLDGVSYKADLLERDLQIVLCPHLVSLSVGFESVEKEVLRLEKLGYHEFFSGFAFLPGRAQPQGSAPRPRELERRRRVSDGGAPRKAVAPGVKSINEAVALRLGALNMQEELEQEELALEAGDLDDEEVDELLGHSEVAPSEAEGEPPVSTYELAPGHELREGSIVRVNGVLARTIGRRKWAKELKPSILDRRRDDTILRHASEQGFGPLLGFADDIKDCFNRTAFAPSQLWMCMFLFFSVGVAAVQTIGFWVEYRLGFGAACSSGIAQRWVQMLVYDFQTELDAVEEPIFEAMLTDLPGDDPRVRWIRTRRTLSQRTGENECRLYSALVYTDDMHCSVVGIRRLVRALRCWRRVVVRFNVRMAGPHKRLIGAALRWIGFDNYSIAGIISIPAEKRARMLEVLNRLVNGEAVTFEEYRSLNGLLEHILPIVDTDRTAFYHLYGGIYREGICGGPKVIVEPKTERVEQWTRWRDRLLQSAGCLVADVASCGAEVEASFELDKLYWHTDAGMEGARVPGLGGYCHGFFFSYALTERDMRLHITALEFLAAVAGVMVFGRLSAGADVVGRVDAQVVDRILNNNSAKSEIMQFIHLKLNEVPELKLPRSVEWEHVYGEANVMADAPSRGEFEAMDLLASHLNIRLRRLELPPAFFELLNEVHAFFDTLPAAEEGAGDTNSGGGMNE